MNSSTFEQGDIVVVDFKFSDFEGSKLRPALVLSTGEYNAQSLDIIVLKITSAQAEGPFSPPLQQEDLEEGSLKKESVTRADFSLAVEKSLIKRRIAKAKPEYIIRIKGLTKKLYDL